MKTVSVGVCRVHFWFMRVRHGAGFPLHPEDFDPFY